MIKDKKFLKVSILISYVFIGMYILFYSVKIQNLRDFNGMYFLFFLSLINNFSLLTFLLSNDRKIIVEHSSLVVLFSLWILLDYIFLYKYKINFKYTYEVSLGFIYLLIFSNIYIFLNCVKEIRWRYINYLACSILLFSFILNYFNNPIHIYILKWARIAMGLFPIILVFTYKRQIRKHSHKLLLNAFFISFIYLIFFVSNYFIPVFNYIYIREFIILFVTELSILIFIISMKSNLKKVILNFYSNPLYIIFIVISTIIFENYIKNYSLAIIFALIFFLNMINIEMIIKLRKIENNKSSYEKFLFNNKMAKDLSENLEKRSLSFLHDDILQDIILSEKFLEEGPENINKSIEIHKKLIKKIRLKINLINPIFEDDLNHYEIYCELINSLKNMYGMDKHIEFYCDENIFIPSPYDSIVYKFIHEITTNFYKHSKGYFSELNLKIEDDVIFIDIKNFEDYLDENYNKSNHSGINFIKETLNIYGGDLVVKNNFTDDLRDEAYVEFVIRLPIQEEIVNESFINRRS